MRGQLGIGSQDAVTRPVRVGTDADWVTVAGGDSHTCGIRNGTGFGGLYCWGGNDYGQLGVGDFEQHRAPELVTENLSFATVAAGEMHTCALEAEGLLWCWGRQEGGAVGLGVVGPPVSVPTRLSEVDMYVALAAGLGHSCALRDDRSLWCWGHYECWQTGSREHPLAPRRVDDRCWHQSGAGIRHSCAIDEAGSLFCFGGNSDGQLGLGFVDGGETDTLEGCNAFDVPQPVMPERSWQAVALGALHSCALTTDGELWCWGFNQQGQVEDSESTVVPEPIRVGTESDWVETCAGFFHTCAANSAGEIFCVGSNEHGQQGTGTWNTELTRVEF